MSSTIKIYPPAPKGGPTTDAGKAIASKNSTTHGLSGSQTVLSYESAGPFDEMVNKYLADFQPETEHEIFTVRQMAEARWKLDRLSRIEAAAFEEMLAPGQPASPDQNIAAALLEKGNVLGKLQRYREALERSYYRAHKEFHASKKARHIDPEVRLGHAYEAYMNKPLPPTREVAVRKTNSLAGSTVPVLQNELPRPANTPAPTSAQNPYREIA